MKINRLLVLMSLFLPLMVSCEASQLKSLNSQEFKKVIDSDLVALFDVRTISEYDAGSIPGSINVDVSDSDFSNIVKKKSQGKVIALYCRSGRRSKLAASKLKDLGVQIYELNRGFLDWQQFGYPVRK